MEPIAAVQFQFFDVAEPLHLDFEAFMDLLMSIERLTRQEAEDVWPEEGHNGRQQIDNR